MAERERSSRGRRRRRGGATVGSGGEPADPAVPGGGSQLRGDADGGSSEAGVQPGERRCSIGLAAASAHSSSGGRLVWTDRRYGETARSSDMAAAPARTSCGAAEHRFGWRDAATPEVTPAAPAATPARRQRLRRGSGTNRQRRDAEKFQRRRRRAAVPMAVERRRGGAFLTCRRNRDDAMEVRFISPNFV
ncbi:hypothetical protein Scep_012764 [Stephania cephalantha]|uniref:Uncharacterized protein n=1 Tax=Stephania cephalantha TaxID=152367 RepID=A0AAP0JFK8_9MAGN